MADLISMLAAAAGAAAGGGEVDPNFNQTVLLLHGDGTNGAQNNTFLDSSTNNFTITRNGNTTQGTFSPFSAPDGRWSNYFDGNDHLSLGTQVIPSSGDFTVEGWFNIDSYAARREIVFQCDPSTSVDGRFFIYVTTAGKLTCFVGGANRPGEMFTTTTVQVGNWYHFAVVRSGNDYTVYLNGVSEATGSGTGTIAANNTLIARNSISGVNTYWLGYLSNIRIATSAVYSGNFTPSSSPLADITNTVLLTCQANRFIDANTQVAAKTVTISGNPKVTPLSPFAPTAAYSASVNGGSGYFDPTGDYLSISDSSNLASPGSGDFTLAAWIYLPQAISNALGASAFYHLKNDTGTSTTVFIGEISSGGAFNLSTGTALIVGGTAGLVRPGQWNYLVASRVSGTLKTFVNGVEDASISNSTTYNGSVVQIGAWRYAASDFSINGFISDLRFVKGSGVTSVTIPTTPLTAITNTSLLLSASNAGIFDNTGKNVLETVGNAQIDTTTKKFGTGSMEFDGTGDYLDAPSSTEFGFLTGAFTVEFWVYLNTVSGFQNLFDMRSGVANQVALCLYMNGASPRLYVSDADRITGSNISASQWYHIALTRSGTDTKLFVDGVQSGSTYTDSNSYLSPRPLRIGTTNDASPQNPLNGFIDDFRITKGVARYTTTFTPPTKAFPDL